MAGPWEKYAQPASAQAAGPWVKYAAPAPKAEKMPDPGFFERHNVLRESLLGGMGSYAAESQNSLGETAKGLKETFATLPKTPAELSLGPFYPGYRMVKGALGQAKQGATEIYEGAGSPKVSIDPLKGKWAASQKPMDTEKMSHGFGTLLGLASQTALPAAESGIAKVRGKVTGALPSTARAGKALGDVKGIAAELPVDSGPYSDSILRIEELGRNGGTMPRSVQKLLNRIVDPEKGPLTFKEARDFYSNISELSADEAMRLKRPMKRAVGQLARDFGESIAQTADRAGQGQKFRAAMKEYAKAAWWRDAADATKSRLKDAAVKAGIATAVGGPAAAVGYGIYKKLTD